MIPSSMNGPASVWRAPTFSYDRVRRKNGVVVIERVEGHNIYVTICSRKLARKIMIPVEHHGV